MPKGKGLLMMLSPDKGEGGPMSGDDDMDYNAEEAVNAAAKAFQKAVAGGKAEAIQAAFRSLHDAEHAYMDDMEAEDYPEEEAS
jgi:hypothetical protein